MATHATRFDIGDLVYLFHGSEGVGMVAQICIRSTGTQYQIRWDDRSLDWHEECELTNERSFTIYGRGEEN